MCGNLSIVPILPTPEWFELRMGPRKGGGGWIGWASTWLYSLTRAGVWQTSVFFFLVDSALLTKFQGVPCQEVGGRVQAVHIWLHCVPLQCATEINAWEAHEEWALWKLDKRVGWLHVTVSVKIPLYHRVHISLHSAFYPKWKLQYFARTQPNKLIKVLLSWYLASSLVFSLMLVLLVLL